MKYVHVSEVFMQPVNLKEKKKFNLKRDVAELYFVSLINILINYLILCGSRSFTGILDSWSFCVKVRRFIFIRKNGGDFPT